MLKLSATGTVHWDKTLGCVRDSSLVGEFKLDSPTAAPTSLPVAVHCNIPTDAEVAELQKPTTFAAPVTPMRANTLPGTVTRAGMPE